MTGTPASPPASSGPAASSASVGPPETSGPAVAAGQPARAEGVATAVASVGPAAPPPTAAPPPPAATQEMSAAPGAPVGRAPGDAAGSASSVVERARRAAESVRDPELPQLTLADLGVLRGVRVADDGTVTADLTPTYSGCPALVEMRADLAARLRAAGFDEVRIRTVLDPPWSTDLITPEGRRKLAEAGMAPPGPAPRRPPGPVPLELTPTRRTVPCPRCGSADTEETSRFSATACRALRRCRACREPFEHVKEI